MWPKHKGPLLRRRPQLQQPQLSVIILQTDATAGPAETLRSLMSQKPAALEIIVVDTTQDSVARSQSRISPSGMVG